MSGAVSLQGADLQRFGTQKSHMKLRLFFLVFFVSVASWGQSVVISQYVETDSGSVPKGIEIFNVTASDIVFSAANNLQVFQGTNGAACTTLITNITGGTLRAGEVWVVGTSDVTSYANTNGTGLSGVTTPGSVLFNGDDAIRIALAGVTQDIVGTCGVDPGTAWTGSGVSTANQNITIIDGLCTGDTDGWTNPSTRFTTISTTPSVSPAGLTGFGNAPASCTTPCTTPTSQVTDVANSNVTVGGTDISWTPGGTASGSIVVIRPSAATNVVPANGVNYNPNTAWASAGQIDTNNRVVYRGAGSSVTGITGLTPETPYVITVYSYNGSGTNICYNTTNPEAVYFVTLAAEATAHAASFTCLTASTSTINLSFSAANTIGGDGYVILYRIGAAPTGVPVDGAMYPGGTVFGDATVHGYTSNAGTTVSYAATGLNAGTTYYFSLVPYSAYLSDPSTMNYRTSATIPVTNCITTLGPEINVRGVIGSNPTIPDGDTTPQGTDNTLFATLQTFTSQAKVFRIENTGNASLQITNINMTTGNNGDFVASGLTFPTNIPVGGYVDFTVTFTPQAAGVRQTMINIHNNDSNEAPYNFYLRGTGTSTPLVEMNVTGNGQSIPDNSIYPMGTNHTAFGVATVGVTTVVRTFTIENTGSTLLSLTGAPLVSVTGPHASMFTVTAQPSSNSIAGSSSLTFTITFNPTAPGAKNATVVIDNNDTDENPYNFNISGTAKGANNIYVYGNGNDVVKGSTTTSVANLTHFGSVAVSTGVKQNTFVVSNLSTVPVFFNDVTITGPDAAMFTVVAPLTDGGLSSGNSTSFTVNFTPTSTGMKNATVTFNTYTNSGHTTPEPVDPVYTFAISGNGITYSPCSASSTQVIAIQDFEVAPATPTYTYTYTTDGTVNVAGGTYNNGSGAQNAFIGARSFQFAGIGASSTPVETAVITMAPINTSAYSNINLSMKVGAFRNSSSQGLDINELIQVETSVDNGVNWSTEAVLRAYSNSRWDFGATGIFNAYYTGTNNGVTIDTRDGNAELPDGIATYNVRNLPAVADLRIRITLAVDRADEIWAIDNVQVQGQLPVVTTWDGAVWTPSAPNATTKAIFNGPYDTVSDGNVTTCACEVNAPVTVGPNTYLDVHDYFENNSTIIVESDGSLIQRNDNGVNTGNNITVRRETSSYQLYDYTYWSSPVNGVTLGGAGMPFSSWNLGYAYSYTPANFIDNITAETGNPPADGFDDDENDWTPAGAGTTMDPGRGYAIMAPTTGSFPTTNTVTFNGQANNGSITETMTFSPSADTTDDYNLVGNPYPSALHANTFINLNAVANNRISGTLYFWTHRTPIDDDAPGPDQQNFISADYATYTLSGGTSSGPGIPAPTGNIATGQGFFVEAQTSGADVEFNNSMRGQYNNSNFYRPSVDRQESETTIDRVWLNLEKGNLFSQQLVAFFDHTTVGYDQAYDGPAYPSGNPVSFYSFVDEKPYRIQARPGFSTDDIVPLGFVSQLDSEYSIKLADAEGIPSQTDVPVYLEDKFTGIVHNLKDGPYNFTTLAGQFDNRFVLRFNTTALGVDEVASTSGVQVAVKSGEISIRSSLGNISSVMVFDLLGRQLYNSPSLSDTTHQIAGKQFAHQALIVKVKLESGQYLTKKIVF